MRDALRIAHRVRSSDWCAHGVGHKPNVFVLELLSYGLEVQHETVERKVRDATVRESEASVVVAQ